MYICPYMPSLAKLCFNKNHDIGLKIVKVSNMVLNGHQPNETNQIKHAYHPLPNYNLKKKHDLGPTNSISIQHGFYKATKIDCNNWPAG